MRTRYSPAIKGAGAPVESWPAAAEISPDERKKRNAIIAAELYKLRIAYPAQSRNFSDAEAKATNALWSEIFAGAPPDVLREAVTRFIITDRKGFFPSPGQIAGAAEQIIKERGAAAERERTVAELREYYRRNRLIKRGFNCGNCAYCERDADGRPRCQNHDGDYYGYFATNAGKSCGLFKGADGFEPEPDDGAPEPDFYARYDETRR
jgi:hypothetical protein